MCLCLSGRLGGDEVAEPRTGRGRLLRNHDSGGNRPACCRSTSGGTTCCGASAAGSTCRSARRWSRGRR